MLSIAEPLLSDLPSVPRPEDPKSVYTGGDYRCQSETGVCIKKYIFLCISVYISIFAVRAQVYVKSNIPLIARGPILLLHLNFLAAGIT